MQLRKAKLKAKRWLNEAKMKTEFQIRKLSFSRSRSTGKHKFFKINYTVCLGPNSIKSQVISSSSVPLKPPCQRAASMIFLPEIVVTTSRVEDDLPAEEIDSSPQSSRQPSR
jgi:hypothetical protein